MRSRHPNIKFPRASLDGFVKVHVLFDRPFDKPFDRLTVLSKVEGLTALSKAEGRRCASSLLIAAY